MSSVINKLAFDGDMNLMRSLDRIYAISVGFFFIKLPILGFLIMDLGDTIFLEGGVANILDWSCGDFCDFICF